MSDVDTAELRRSAQSMKDRDFHSVASLMRVAAADIDALRAENASLKARERAARVEDLTWALDVVNGAEFTSVAKALILERIAELEGASDGE